MTDIIRIEDVTWTYPHADEPSLRGLDLSIGEGEVVVLCGASGSGKSTALRLLNGLVPQFHDEGVLTGAVTVAGLVTTAVELDALGAVTGTVLQHPRRQFFTDSARDEVAFAMENLGFEREHTRSRVDATLAELSLYVPLGQSLQRLSGGQQQQIAIASAAAHEPRILLLDEPSSNLSVDAIARLTATLIALKAAGMTIVVAEHRLRYLQDVLDRVVVMRGGEIDVVWTADEFREIPDETLAAEGLRGVVRPTTLPEIAAAGASAASPAASVPPAALVLDGVRCTLGGRRVIDLDRAAFASGEVTAIRGTNGAGKSTLARIITGLQRSVGSVRLDGVTLSPRARQRSSAVVMQDVQRQLFTETVSAEIALAGTDSPVTDSDAVLASLDLDHLADRHPLSMSGGQQQRLVVAAVRVARRRIVVFDEPSSGVDRRHLQSIAEQIRRVAADGAVVLLISHDEDLVALAADRQLSLVNPSSATVPAAAHESVKEST
ncbi:ATP-binding cassette domain-containing protein [Mycetocola reblochoni]|nr:ABC transporter ATP-binding protein [Mycetocola reblochoni]